MMRRICAAVLCLILCLTGLPAQAETAMFYTLGSKVEDFTLTTYDGQTITLSEVLKEKDMVLLNIWASWCGPCETEFPYLEQAYQQYKEDVAVIAVSCEVMDTNDVLADYAQRLGLTFPVAQDTANLATRFYAASIPMSVVIDRFGTVCFMESGAQTSVEAFTNLFDAFVGEGYTSSMLLESIPTTKPNIPAAAEDKLAEALNVDGGTLSFRNSGNAYAWPMIPAEEDGRDALMSTNAGADGMQSAVYTTVQAQAGDALAVTFKTSSEAACDLFTITVNGETVKVFGGEKEWMTYAHAFEAAGEYIVGLHYIKDAMDAAGGDVVYIDSVALLSGEDAAAAVAANPAYPVAGATTLTVVNENARQITFDDPSYALLSMFGLADYYIVNGETAQLVVTLDEAADPEAALLTNYYDGSVSGVAEFPTTEGYLYETPIDSTETTGYSYTNLHLYPAADSAVMDVRTVVCFASEENANAFVTTLSAYGYGVTGWRYIDGTEAETDALPGEGVEETEEMPDEAE
ncbi:MAG: TlpA family protein disulfide reductase [Clostridia bacterium]|nr:TlpA family protein disulfide reductase [Clostridia bacterium]